MVALLLDICPSLCTMASVTSRIFCSLRSSVQHRQPPISSLVWAQVNNHIVATSDHELSRLMTEASFPELGSTVQRKSTRPGQIWHCDTIPIQTPSWDRITQALVIVDDYSRKVYLVLQDGVSWFEMLAVHGGSRGIACPGKAHRAPSSETSWAGQDRNSIGSRAWPW